MPLFVFNRFLINNVLLLITPKFPDCEPRIFNNALLLASVMVILLSVPSAFFSVISSVNVFCPAIVWSPVNSTTELDNCVISLFVLFNSLPNSSMSVCSVEISVEFVSICCSVALGTALLNSVSSVEYFNSPPSSTKVFICI